MLHEGRIGPFARMARDPEFREERLDPRTGSLHQAHWEGNTLVVTGVDAALSFRFDPPRLVRGVRLKYDHEGAQLGPAHFRLEWRGPGQADVPAEQTISEWGLPSGEDRELTLWPVEMVAELRIRPDNRPCRFRVRDLTLLE
jgi:hypothetical protein